MMREKLETNAVKQPELFVLISIASLSRDGLFIATADPGTSYYPDRFASAASHMVQTGAALDAKN
jgi:hypothetical protein